MLFTSNTSQLKRLFIPKVLFLSSEHAGKTKGYLSLLNGQTINTWLMERSLKITKEVEVMWKWVHNHCIHVLPWHIKDLQKPGRKSEAWGQISCPWLLSMKPAWLDQQILTSVGISSSWQQVACRPNHILTSRRPLTLSLTLFCAILTCAQNKWIQDVDLQMWIVSKLVTAYLEAAVFQGKLSPMRRLYLERWAATKYNLKNHNTHNYTIL